MYNSLKRRFNNLYYDPVQLFMMERGLCESCMKQSKESDIYDSYCPGCHDGYMILRTKIVSNYINWILDKIASPINIHAGEGGQYVQIPATDIELEDLPEKFQKHILEGVNQGSPEGWRTDKLKIEFWAEAYITDE